MASPEFDVAMAAPNEELFDVAIALARASTPFRPLGQWLLARGPGGRAGAAASSRGRRFDEAARTRVFYSAA